MNNGHDNDENKYKNDIPFRVYLSCFGGGGRKSGLFYSHNCHFVLLYQSTLVLSGDNVFKKTVMVIHSLQEIFAK
jgi:hypothetical protein